MFKIKIATYLHFRESMLGPFGFVFAAYKIREES